MNKVDFRELKNAVVVIDNSVDAARNYDISASVSVDGLAVGSISKGVVRTRVTEGEGKVICQFSKPKGYSANYGFFAGDERHSVIVAEVESFVDAIHARMAESGITDVVQA